MNKAFVKDETDFNDDFYLNFDPSEDDTAIEEDILNESSLGGPKNYITARGFERLKNEMDTLINQERPRLTEMIVQSSGENDFTENAELMYAKKRLREMDRRIRFLQKRMDLAEVVSPEMQSGERILFGATVTVQDEDEKTRVYRIVGVDETDAKAGKISWISPIGQALLQAKVGDFVILRTPSGEEDLEIQKIEYKPID